MSKSLRESLNYEPVELQFGTSGRRGNVVDLTQLEIYINSYAEIEYLLSLTLGQGGIEKGQDFYFAYDLRPSSTALAPEEKGRGELAQAIVKAIEDSGLKPINLGPIPTPALTCYAIGKHCGSIMVTGSHIPFARNGYKTNTSLGELLKKDEAPIAEHVKTTRARIYTQDESGSIFGANGMLKAGHKELPAETSVARDAYIARYENFFGGASLNGQRVLIYQHSAVGRDILVDVLRRLGADVIPAGRSDTFVPIDTENIDDAQLAVMQDLADEATQEYGPLFAVVSTDGDSDRPLILGVHDGGNLRFFGGDLVGMIVADYLGADAVVVPISCNDGIDRGTLKDKVQPKTKIGSPHVIAGMQQARADGKTKVCGWEANGGFLTGSDFAHDGKTLTALPTRDAFLPILSTLFAANTKHEPVIAQFELLPKRFSKAALLKNFPRATSLNIVAEFSPKSTNPTDIQSAAEKLSPFFKSSDGFSSISTINTIDGVRVIFTNGDVAHIRPSGNADELRIYAVADTQTRADQIAQLGVAEPNGILRSMAKAVEK